MSELPRKRRQHSPIRVRWILAALSVAAVVTRPVTADAAAAEEIAPEFCVGEVWGMGLESASGRRLLAHSGAGFVKLLARPEFLRGDIGRALDDPRHTPWPWLDSEFRTALSVQIGAARDLGLEVVLVLDPGATAVSPQTLAAINGRAPLLQGDPWLLPRAGLGYTAEQIDRYADLAVTLARACELRFPGTVTWIQIGNEPSARQVFVFENYLDLVRTTVERVARAGVTVRLLAGDGDLCSHPFFALRLAEEMGDGELPDALGFHFLPQFDRCALPSVTEHARRLRRALAGKRTWRGLRTEVWCDEWSFLPQSGSAGSRDTADSKAIKERVFSQLGEQRAARLDRSALVSLVALAPLARRDWALSDTDGLQRFEFRELATRLLELRNRVP